MNLEIEIKNKWDLLSLGNVDSPLIGKELNIIPFGVTKNKEEISFGLDGEKNRHILVKVDPKSKIIEDKKSKGIHIVEKPVADGTTKELKELYIDIILKDQKFSNIYNIFLLNLLKKIINNKVDSNKASIELLHRWRSFFNKIREKLIPEEIAMGLFGELYLLTKLLEKNNFVIERWTGPEADRHDFQNDDVSIEVKVTKLSRHRRNFKINSLHQLSKQENRELFLFTLIIEKSQDDKDGLGKIIQRIRSKIPNSMDFVEKITQMGVDLNILDKYDEHFKYRIIEGEDRFYEVDENFPRIVSSSFKEEDLPNGVENLTYTINLNSEPPIPLSKDEEELLLHKMIK